MRGATLLLAAAALLVPLAGGAAPPRLGGTIEGYGVLRLDRGSPRQRPQARLWLGAEQALGDVRWRLSTLGLWGGTIEDASGAGLIDFGHVFQNVSPSLELDEAWVEWLGESFDVRVGNQKFSWGRLDAFQPNDLLNPRRWYDPFVIDGIAAKIAVPAVAASYLAPTTAAPWLGSQLRLALVWVPIAVPWRFPLPDERWFPPVAKPPPEIVVPERDGVCPCVIGVTQKAVNAPPPARRFDNGTVAVRATGTSHGVDWALTYFDGFDPEPSFEVPIRLTTAGPGPAIDAAQLTAETELRPAFQRLRAVGAEAALVVGGATLRAEAAWKFDRAIGISVREVGTDLLADPEALERLLAGETVTRPAFARRDVAEWGIGVDYLIDGYLPLVEVHQLVVLDNDRRLLIPDVDTRLVANLRKRWLEDRLEVELVGLWGIEAGYELVRAEAGYALSDAVEARVGLLGIWGSRNSLVGEFSRNAEAYLRLRYVF